MSGKVDKKISKQIKIWKEAQIIVKLKANLFIIIIIINNLFLCETQIGWKGSTAEMLLLEPCLKAQKFCSWGKMYVQSGGK